MAFVVFSAQYQFAVLCAKPLFFVGFLTTPSSTLPSPSGLPIRLVHRGQLSCRSFSEGSWQRLKHRDYWLHRRGAVPNASDLVGRAPHSSGAQLTPCAIRHRQHSPPSKVFSLSPLTQYILVPVVSDNNPNENRPTTRMKMGQLPERKQANCPNDCE